MAEQRRGRVLVFTSAGEFAFNHIADSQGNYWLAEDAESAIAERDATIERLRAELEAEQARTICAMCGNELTEKSPAK